MLGRAKLLSSILSCSAQPSNTSFIWLCRPPLLDPCLDLGFVALVARVVEAAVFVDVGQVLLRDPVTFVV